MFVLAGHIASAESWAKFSLEWERLLPRFGALGPKGYRFKMSEINALRNGDFRDVAPFFRALENHVLLSLSVSFKVSDLRRAQARIMLPGYTPDAKFWGWVDNPYMLAFKFLMDGFHVRYPDIERIIGKSLEPVDFIFDEQTEKSLLLPAWDRYVQSRPPAMRERFGKTPRFENDDDFLPLQGADFWAWWVRVWTDAGEHDKLAGSDFGPFKAKRHDWPKALFSWTQDQITTDLLRMVHENNPGVVTYDWNV